MVGKVRFDLLKLSLISNFVDSYKISVAEV